MTIDRILALAYDQQLYRWDIAKQQLEAMPNNSIRQHRVEKIWNELTELTLLIRKFNERKENGNG